ncbi:exopolysaccharide synthesis ExoD [Puniceibacterium antarcticum]|uniref:Exopolysaccharide synthesis ExoD n=1 Tax=Puniceibacterium antarcticum TaxID=1206336 RepID=A0A2G8RIB5_9RHOB|nr:exopolysaccharide biosynthesis protein [Puniceibacterium antarcticum]PIL21336.1 exopolysaccharide synthesis ExoD [Puniceibacterium antarcticum]
MKAQDRPQKRPSLSLPILRTSRDQHRAGTLTLGNLLSAIGETSFGWAIVLFSLITLLPLPPGSTLLTALPLLVTTVQMSLGYPHVRLPGPLARLRLDQGKIRVAILRLRPVTRRLERILKPRYAALFTRRNERLIGVLLFIIAFALFLPVPLSGWFPAISLFTIGVGIVERDGLVTAAGMVMGAASVVLTATILLWLAAGADALIH